MSSFPDQPAQAGAGTGPHPPAYATADGGTPWLAFFAGDPEAGDEGGELICPVSPGDSWQDLASTVRRHVAGHGCDLQAKGTPS